jgi:carboxyl-terminal processing protease
VVREGEPEPFDVSIVRDTIQLTAVRARTVGNTAVLRLTTFNEQTYPKMKEGLEQQIEDAGGMENINGIVIDMRNNPGGLLQASVQVVDEFINDGLIVYTEGRLPNAYSRFMASAKNPADDTPMVVLINGGSASASEIVAGALQDHRRAIIVGTQSFGKGSVQTVLPLSEDSAIKLTTARYYTPSGSSIQAQGIIPDIVVEKARIEAVNAGIQVTEADLAGHLGRGDGAESDGKSRKKEKNDGNELAANDNQLYEALNLLKGLYIMSSAKKALAEAEGVTQ